MGRFSRAAEEKLALEKDNLTHIVEEAEEESQAFMNQGAAAARADAAPLPQPSKPVLADVGSSGAYGLPELGGFAAALAEAPAAAR